MSKFNELVTKLREIFQIDRPELDFGIYRILNARADEINEYLEKRLKQKVHQALESGSAANVDQLKEELKKAEQGAQALGVDADTVPKVQELKAKISEATSGNAEHENAVFSHLLTFFSRYYDQGDFISQRRYKGDTYSIPYAGEEVMLHWANKDQYYIKSGENFSNYSFKLEDGRVVHFRLVSADTAKDNRKDNDKERRFVLAEHRFITRVDDEGHEYEEEVLPVEEIVKTDAEGNETKELVIRFEYKAMPKGSKQDKLVEKAVDFILTNEIVANNWLAIGVRSPTEKKPRRTLLEKHLIDYTTKNTSDYFIHKNLKGFLLSELDFYVKNEVMNLDDVQNVETFAAIEKNLRVIQCLREIAVELIAFLSKLENFQKKMWVKRKFIHSVSYLISIGKIPESLHPKILTNERQFIKWAEDYKLLDIRPEKDFLDSNPNLLLDTSLFDDNFTREIINSINDLDENISGILINSDNYQALNLLRCKYFNAIQCVYADPPYNAKSSEIIYKNGFKHSSWLALMDGRFSLAKDFKAYNGALITAIDENEYSKLSMYLTSEHSSFETDSISIVHNPAGVQGDNFSYSHEYALYTYDKQKNLIGQTLREEPSIEAFRDWGGTSARRLAKTCFYPIIVKEGKIVGFGDVCEDDFHPEGPNVMVGDLLYVYPISEDGEERKWVFSRDSVERILDDLIVNERAGVTSISRRKTETSYKTVWSGNKFYANIYGSKFLNNMFGEKRFDFPKSIHTLEECLWAVNSFRKKDSIALDYFGGSGTTAHAVININRRDNGARKFIIVEMGDHFDTVIKPRVVKASYSSEWEKGKPKAHDQSISVIYKVLRLESYEDTLNNINLERTASQQSLLDSDDSINESYLLNYMLDIESRSSFLSTDDFIKPFDYRMNITTDSAGAFKEQRVDLVETFNFLLGLTVKQIDAQPERGFVTVIGTLPTGESCLVLWRDCELIDYDGLNKLCDKLAINPADNEFDVVYINGDHNIPTVLTQTAEEGGETRVLKLRQIEPEFLERMFAEEDV